MARVKFLGTEKVEFLREHHIVGRRVESVDTRLDYPFVSKLHLVIEWKDPNWLIRDMSHNGTWLNGERLVPQVSAVINSNDIIDIAGADGIRFQVCDTHPPANTIYQSDSPLNSTPLIDSIFLPNDEKPEIGLYKCPDRLQWFSEPMTPNPATNLTPDDEQLVYETGPYQHGDIIECSDTQWQLFLVSENALTIELDSPSRDIADVEFRFDLSQDEESTNLTLIHGDVKTDLAERSHHYLLAHLLRHRSVQSKEHNNVNDQGWIKSVLLAQELGIDETYLNIQIFRARKQISSALAGFRGSSQLIERRRGSIRTGISKFSIFKGGLLEA